MRFPIALVVLAVSSGAQDQPRLKSRSELSEAAKPAGGMSQQRLWVVPAGTRIPLQLRQPVSTKTAQPGDPIYAQTSFPIVVDGNMAIPAGTWMQGVVDSVRRAGRMKKTAELQFHLTTLIYANGYTLDMAAAIEQVPGDASTHIQEPGKVAHDSEKGKDLERVGEGALKGGQIGMIAGAATNSIRGMGVGGISGIAAGTLIALLARGSDVRFDTGTAVEISLGRPIAIEPAKVNRGPNPAGL